MKKLLVLLTFCMIFLVSCDRNINIEEVEEDVRSFYNELESCEYTVSVLTSIYNKSQAFLLDFTYNADKSDQIVIIKPEEVSGITAYVEENSENIEISFEDVQIETLLTENIGISPVDVTSFAIFDLKNKKAESIAVSDTIKISYVDEKISKDVFLNYENYDIIKVEVYVDGSMVVSCCYA
ncbi:MAG: hypothetical protein R3Y12_06490 [Clostridia bacterium]